MSGREPEVGDAGPRRLTRAEFVHELRAQAGRLWTLAVGILGDPTEAEDVVQEAALLALSKLSEFDARTSFGAWLSTFVRNVALNAARKRKRRATHPAPTEAFLGFEADGRPGPGGVLDGGGNLLPDQTAFDDRVLAALGELSPTARAALLLRTVLDLSYAEISDVLEVPEGTAMSHVHRARQRMRDALLADDEPADAPAPPGRDELAMNPDPGEPR